MFPTLSQMKVCHGSNDRERNPKIGGGKLAKLMTNLTHLA